jgi:hypothetical protein
MTESQSDEFGRLPKTGACVTQFLEPVGLVECLVKSPQKCPYALAFGDGFFCQHPDCREFLKRASAGT